MMTSASKDMLSQNKAVQETVWLTGASSGLGYELALELAHAGYKVIASARTESALRTLANEHANIFPLVFDVTDQSQILKVREEIAQTFGALDRIILNAGVCEYFDIDKPDWDMMRRVMEVNYFGVINSLALAFPLLKVGAHVVVVSSMATFAPFPRSQAYGASKAALNYFMSAMKVDLATRFIDVTIVNPGFVETPLTQANDFPMPFIIDAKKAAKIIVQRLPSRSININFPFQFSLLLKAANFFPSVWFKFLAARLTRNS